MTTIKNLIIEQLLLVQVTYGPRFAYMTKQQQNDYNDMQTYTKILQKRDNQLQIIRSGKNRRRKMNRTENV